MLSTYNVDRIEQREKDAITPEFFKSDWTTTEATLDCDTISSLSFTPKSEEECQIAVNSIARSVFGGTGGSSQGS